MNYYLGYLEMERGVSSFTWIFRWVAAPFHFNIATYFVCEKYP